MLAPGPAWCWPTEAPPMPPAVQGFGRSLLHAIRAMLSTAGYGGACVLNSDSPTLPTDYLRRAVAALWRRRPGGARSGRGRRLLSGRRQGTARAPVRGYRLEHRAGRRADPRARADAGMEVVELPQWYDVDDRVGLYRLLDELRAPPPGAYPAPATAARIAGLNLRRQRRKRNDDYDWRAAVSPSRPVRGY